MSRQDLPPFRVDHVGSLFRPRTSSPPDTRYVPLDQLCLSPQCGFSSTVEGNVLTLEEEEAKLRLVVETAHEGWG